MNMTDKLIYLLLAKNANTASDIETQTLPFTFKSNGRRLKNYQIYGNTGGVGDLDSNTNKYIIPVTINGTVTNISLDSPLGDGDYIDFHDQKRYNSDNTSAVVSLPAITTVNGINILDIDTTVTGATLSIPEIESIIREIISIQVEDNISFDIKNISEIMDEAEYPGLRVSLEALLDNMRTPLKIDISTGDVITPHEIVYEYPLMFEKRTIPIFAYNLETILAEKLQSILARGSANTRLRDYYDLCILSDTVDINYNDLRAAFFATCKNRGTLSLIPNKDLVLSQIHSDSGMKALWESYQRKYSYAKDYAWIDVMKKLELMFNRIVSD